MISVTRLEHACADAWPAQVDEPLGEWRLRAAGGFTGRANSALAVGDPGRDLPAALTAVCEFSHHHAISPLLQTVRGGPIEHALPALGWAPQDDRPAGGEVAVLLGPAVPPVPVPGHRVEVRAEPTPGWWELTVGRQQPTDAERGVLTGGDPVGYGLVTGPDGTRGAVRGALGGGLLFVARLAVRPQHRRTGLATALMAGIGTWGERHGAPACVLQVSADNTAALTLYERLGFREHHRYRYWAPCEDRAR